MQIGKGKSGVKIGEYANQDDGGGTLGWIEPACDNPQWILWFTPKGDGLLYTERDKNGGIIGDPIRIPATNPTSKSKTLPSHVATASFGIVIQDSSQRVYSPNNGK